VSANNSKPRTILQDAMAKHEARLRPEDRFTVEELGDAYEGDLDLGPDADSKASCTSSTSLTSSLRSWPVMGAEALYGLPGVIVAAIEPTSEADPAGLLAQTLVSYGSLIGRTAHFQAEDDTHYLNEFLCLVGRTSKGRKGMSWGRVRSVVQDADPDWAERRIMGGLSSGEGLIEAVRDERRDQKGEVVAAAAEDKRLLAAEGEFASVLKQVERQGNTLSAILRQAWDGGRLRTMTRSNPLCATDAHISIIAHCTMTELVRLLSNTETANGFANRFLWVAVRRSKVLPEGGRLDPDVLADLRRRFREAVEFGHDVREMRRTPVARALWCDVYGDLSEGRPGLAGSLLARAEAHVMRLACIYALMDQNCFVDEPHLRAALAFWDYCEQSVRYIWGDSLGDPMADAILRGLQASPGGLSRQEINDKVFKRNKPSEDIARALSLLAEFGLARMERRDTGGRKAEERWYEATKSTKSTK
jgi:hypothetical protein